jgi:hypothetical protein
VALAAGFAAGFVMDKGVSGTPVPTVAGATSAAVTTAPGGQSAGAWLSPLPSAHVAANTTPPAPGPGGVAGDPLASLERLAAGTDAAQVERVANVLSQAMRTDDRLRRRAFAAYLKAPNEAASMRLAIALSALEGPEIAQAALEASGPQRTLPERLAALQLLANSNVELPAARDRLRTSLTNGTVTDPALVAATLTALRPRSAVSTSEQSDMQAMMQPYLRSPDAAVRQQAIDTMTAWAPREPGTVEVLKAAVLDPSPDVRASAVSAYARSAASPAEARDVLVGRMADEREALGVRQAAAIALGEFAMDPATKSAYEKFKEKHLGQP